MVLGPAGSTEPRQMPRLHLGTQQLRCGQDQPQTVITCFCCRLAEPGSLAQTGLGLSPQALARRRGTESTSCTAVPEVKHLRFAQGVLVSVRT